MEALSFEERFDQYWEMHFTALAQKSSPWILAVSGGIDSIVLAHLLHKKGKHFILAHCNFHLREESDRDQAFVAHFAKSRNLDFTAISFDTKTFAQEQKCGLEEAARKLRYDWFQQLSDAHQQAPVLIAHHANDNIETVLFHFFRGTGIAGMHGILPIQGNIYRPLLFALRKEILQYALAEKLQWVEDKTNWDNSYTRNFLRLDILPELKNYFPQIENNILGNISRFKDIERIYNAHIATVTSTLAIPENDIINIKIDDLLQYEYWQTVLYEIVKKYHFTATQLPEICKIATASSGSLIKSSSHGILKDRKLLLLFPLATTSIHLQITETDTSVHNDQYLFYIEHLSNAAPLHYRSDTAYLDADKLQWPLQIDTWKQGDSFQPLGMNGKKKKVSDFFVDQKLSVLQKQSIPILRSGNNICWIVSMRMDERYKVTASTCHILKITAEKL